VQLTFADEDLVAVTVAVAPSVIPETSIVGVLSRVELSIALIPVSERELRSGAEVSSICTSSVGNEVPTTLAATLVAVTTDRM
jgi:hypothetical protein